MKKAELSTGTCLDACMMASRRIAGPQGGHFGEFSPVSVNQTNENQILVATATFACTMKANTGSVISGDLSGQWVNLPYAY